MVSRPSRRNPLNPLDVIAQRAPRLFQIIVRLQAKPETLAGAQRRSEAQRGIRADAALAEHDLVDAARRHGCGARERVLADAERTEKFFQQDFAGVDVGDAAFRHGPPHFKPLRRRGATCHPP